MTPEPEDYRFPRSHRLLNAADFDRVFAQVSLKAGTRSYLLLCRENQLDHPRIGFIIGKKHLKKAHDRNRIKRQVRESFRHHQHQLGNLDIIFLAKPGLKNLENPSLRQSLLAQWQKLASHHSGR